MFGVTDLQPLVDQINTDKALVKSASLALTMSPLEDRDKSAQIPAVFLYPAGSDAEDLIEGQNVCSQSSHELIVVDYICKLTDLTNVTLEVRKIMTRFNGFSPYHGTIAFAYPPRVGGSTSQIQGMDGGIIWWQDKFEVRLEHRVGQLG